MSSSCERGWAVVDCEAVLAGYEALRRRALEQGAAVAQELGWVLLVRRGMSAWMDSWRQLVASPILPLPPRLPGSPAGAPALAGVSAEAVRVIAGMAWAIAQHGKEIG